MSKVIMGHNLTLHLNSASKPFLCATQCQLQLDVDMLETAPTANGTAREFIPVSTSYAINADGYLPLPCTTTMTENSGYGRVYLGQGWGLPTLVKWSMQVYVPVNGDYPEGVRIIHGQAYLKSQALTSPLNGPVINHITLQGTGAIEDTGICITNIRYSLYQRLSYGWEDEEEATFWQDAEEVAWCGYHGHWSHIRPTAEPGQMRFRCECRLRISMVVVFGDASFDSLPFYPRHGEGAHDARLALTNNSLLFDYNGNPQDYPAVADGLGEFIRLQDGGFGPGGDNVTCYLLFGAGEIFFADQFTYSIR